MTTELLPCPHCGSKASVHTMPNDGNCNDGGQFVMCDNSACMAASALVFPLGESVENLLMERWNRRAAVAQPSAEPAKEDPRRAQMERAAGYWKALTFAMATRGATLQIKDDTPARGWLKRRFWECSVGRSTVMRASPEAALHSALMLDFDGSVPDSFNLPKSMATPLVFSGSSVDALPPTGAGEATAPDLVHQAAALSGGFPDAADVRPGWQWVPVQPTEAMWGELSRDLVWFLYSHGAPHYGSKLHRFLENLGREVPAWLAKEIPDVDHSPPKGTFAACIYKAMLAAAPSPKEKT